MAEGGTEEIPREYFVDSDYRAESRGHLCSRDGSTLQAGNVCRFYLIGQCMYGDNCWYAHAPSGPRAGSSHRAEMDVQHSGQSRRLQNRALHAEGGDCRSAELAPESSSAARSTPQTGPFSVRQRGSSAFAWGGHRAFNTQHSSSWVDAPGLVPRSEIACTRPQRPEGTDQAALYGIASLPLCPHESPNHGCLLRERCSFVHRDVCDLCQKLCLNPDSKEQRMQHTEQCVRRYAQNMAAQQRNADKTCGICQDIVIHKELPSDRRFGILDKCGHVFCLGCIRKWRASKEVDSEVARSCPLCRTLSNFVTPSNDWVDTPAEKDNVIANYKSAMSEKPCRYFNGGQGICRFGDACFYQHSPANGNHALMSLPRPRFGWNRDSI